MITIRHFEPQDTPQIINLISTIMEQEFPLSLNMYALDDLSNPAVYYGGKKDIFLVAEREGQIVGTVAIKEDDTTTALLRRLFLRKDFRGKGCGKKLLDEAMNFCAAHHYRKVIFRGTDLMKSALQMCMKNGFSEKDILDLPHSKMFILEKHLHAPAGHHDKH